MLTPSIHPNPPRGRQPCRYTSGPTQARAAQAPLTVRAAGAQDAWPRTTGSQLAHQPPSCFSTFWMMALLVKVSSSSLWAL